MQPGSHLPSEAEFKQRLAARHRRGTIGRSFYFVAIFIAVAVLVILFLNVINESFGTVAVQYEVPAETVTAGKDLDELDSTQLGNILTEQLGRRVRVVIRDELSQVTPELFTTVSLREVLRGLEFPPETGDLLINDLDEAQLASLLTLNLSQNDLRRLVSRHVIKEEVVGSWSLLATLFKSDTIEAEAAADSPDAELRFKSWLSRDFLTEPMSSIPALAGVRTAVLGTFYMMALVIVVALPVGVGAAIYLEEFASDNRLNRFLETNIRNLAGVPSIIYGMLGLAIFVRALAAFTSGSLFGGEASSGRTIISAALTLALLVLPIIIINAQEAIRAVPRSLREASYGLGATQWQTVWYQVLPAALPGIFTGSILAISRAIGETAPLIVVGASTFIALDPDGPFSQFTALPIQIFQWTARPQDQFRDIAAAAIIVLLVLMLTLNAGAIILRNRYSKRY